MKVGDAVEVVGAIDVEIHDVRKHYGRRGVVERIVDEGPEFGVLFAAGDREFFWADELCEVAK